jgi:hypothetical protein
MTTEQKNRLDATINLMNLEDLQYTYERVGAILQLLEGICYEKEKIAEERSKINIKVEHTDDTSIVTIEF